VDAQLLELVHGPEREGRAEEPDADVLAALLDHGQLLEREHPVGLERLGLGLLPAEPRRPVAGRGRAAQLVRVEELGLVPLPARLSRGVYLLEGEAELALVGLAELRDEVRHGRRGLPRAWSC